MKPSQKIPVSSKRRSLIESASKILTPIDRPKSRRERLPDSEGNARIKISSPFDFRDISKESSSSDDSVQARRTPVAQQTKFSASNAVLSPLEKPLPSLPVATITTNSPVKVRRSLIDAQEKPLRRSLSPQQHSFEDWPSLSPEKGSSTNSTKKMSSTIKPSISESLVERVNKFSLNDDANENPRTLNMNDTATATSPSSPAASEYRALKKPPAHETKTSVPVVRQTRTSELRLRMSTSMEDHQHKKPKSPLPLSVTSGNVTTRSRPRKRRPDTPRSQASAARSRSRSRHRATAQGSPYMLNTERVGLPGDKQEHSLILDPNKIDTDFSSPDHVSGSPEGRSAQANDQGEMCEEQKSSTPFPELLSQKITNDYNQTEVGANRESCGSLEDTEHQKLTGSQMDTVVAEQLDLASSPILTAASAEPTLRGEVAYKDMDGENLSENGLGSIKEVKVRLLSQKAPQYGPVLRISAEIEKFIENTSPDGINDPNNSTDAQHTLDMMGSNDSVRSVQDSIHPTTVTSNEVESTTCKERAPSIDPMQLDDKPAQAPHSEQQHSIETRNILREPPPVQSISNAQRNIMHATTTSAPPVKPGAPKDSTCTTAWPFKESAVAPFKTSATPERRVGKSSSNSTGSNRNSSNSSHLEPSPGYSVQSRFDIGEALNKIKPQDQAAMGKISSVNASADARKAAAAPHAFPPRTSSKYVASARPTGRRLNEIRSSIGSSVITPPPRNPLRNVSNSTPRPYSAKTTTSSTSGALNTTLSQRTLETLSPSSIPNAGSPSAGKGVLNNIRSLFHKRSNLHPNMHGSLHLPKRNHKHHGPQSTNSAITPSFSTALTQSRLPRSPQVKGTSALATAAHPIKPSPRMFPSNPAVHPLAHSSPGLKDKQLLLPEDATTKPHKSQAKSTTLKPDTPPTKLEPQEIQSATDLVYRLLETVQQDETARQKKEQLLELSKLLVSALTAARDAEKALEQANIAASKCELQCLEVRKRVGDVDRLVRTVVGFEDGEK